MTAPDNAPGGIATHADRQFREFTLSFDRAAESGPDFIVTADFVIGGQIVRFRVVGPGLARSLTRPFRHLSSEGADRDPVLYVDFWHEGETGIGCDSRAPRAAGDTRPSFSASADGRFVITEQVQSKTIFDRRDRRIIGWVGAESRLSQYEVGRPLHSELLLWLREHGLLPVHSGLVAVGDDAVLFGGPGGSGKSTVALTCLMAGLGFLADDYVGVEERAGIFRGHSLYSSTHLEPGHLARFPELEPHATPGSGPDEDKSLIMLSEVFEERLPRSARIRAIALPIVVDSEDTRFRAASKVETLLRLAPSSLLVLPYTGAGPRGFEQLSAMVEQLPTLWLELGRDLEQIPLRVREILETAGETS